MTHLDTSFLVDLLRGNAPARALLATLRDEDCWVSVHVACDLAAGAALSRSPKAEQAKVRRLLDGVQVAYPGEGFAEVYGALLAQLSRKGRRVSVMDLLIAAAAVRDRAPLVTRDPRDFERVPGLTVITYEVGPSEFFPRTEAEREADPEGTPSAVGTRRQRGAATPLGSRTLQGAATNLGGFEAGRIRKDYLGAA